MPEAKVRPKSWKFRNEVRWAGEKRGVLSAGERPDLEVATPVEFRGHAGIWSPEDLFVASVNACVMTTFLYYAARAGIELLDYRSEAEGTVVYEHGLLRFADVHLRPTVVVASEAARAEAERCLQQSEEHCLVSRSVAASVRVEGEVRVSDGA